VVLEELGTGEGSELSLNRSGPQLGSVLQVLVGKSVDKSLLSSLRNQSRC
jgi:hypothetical protein